MGFNIGISISPSHEDFRASLSECSKFLERRYFEWVSEYDVYGNDSCIIKTGNFFGLDLEPLTRLIYVNDEVDDEYISSGLQKTEELVKLVGQLIRAVEQDRSFIDKISYKMSSESGPDVINTDIESNPWRNYILDGDFVEHLHIVMSSLQCFKSRGHEELFFKAG